MLLISKMFEIKRFQSSDLFDLPIFPLLIAIQYKNLFMEK